MSFSDLDDYLKKNNIDIREGYSGQVLDQQNKLIEILNKYKPKNILEIGFNAGHSSELFLLNSDANIVSFDIGFHNYVYDGKKYIDLVYPSRHELIIGDSTKSLPEYIVKNPTKKFDLLFIDGGHDYEIAKSDLKNCFKLSNENSIVIIDDTVLNESSHRGYTIGPTKIWNEWKNKKKIYEIESLEFFPGRGMSYGKYNLNFNFNKKFKNKKKNKNKNKKKIINKKNKRKQNKNKK